MATDGDDEPKDEDDEDDDDTDDDDDTTTATVVTATVVTATVTNGDFFFPKQTLSGPVHPNAPIPVLLRVSLRPCYG